MPLQNKIDPFGAIMTEAMRGLFMGNRGGKMHDAATQTFMPGRTHVSRQWIACLTEFKGRSRKVMGPGYTELFFLDEVVSLAAGHRPCAECRRAAFKQYRAAIGEPSIKAPELDQRLHAERMGPRLRIGAVGELPDGAMIGCGETAYARLGSAAVPFGFAGYGPSVNWRDVAKPDAVVLTPPTSLLALRGGYRPVWHQSAGT